MFISIMALVFFFANFNFHITSVEVEFYPCGNVQFWEFTAHFDAFWLNNSFYRHLLKNSQLS